jgi:hypothetical protein
MNGPRTTDDPRRTILSATEARQAAPVGRLRYVLIIGLVLAVGVMATCYVIFLA